MEITAKTHGSDSPISKRHPKSYRRSCQELLSKSSMSEPDLLLRQNNGYEVTDQEKKLIRSKDELSQEIDSLRRRIWELESQFSEAARETEEMREDLEVSRERIRELEAEAEETSEFLSSIAESIQSVENHLLTKIGYLNNQEEVLDLFPETGGKAESELDEKPRAYWEEKLSAAVNLAVEAESKIKVYMESSEKQKMEVESSLVVLKEENRDICGLLRVAIMEKEAAEKRLKGLNEHKRAALLQIAERGLQRVGLGFGFGFRSMMENSGIGNGEADHGSDTCEEEESLASTVEKTMKNLRHEVSQLRASLEESRLDNERLQRMAQKQAQKLAENSLYISKQRDRERVLAQNVDDLVMELRETEADVCRWREACELEVEAGRHEVEERDSLMTIMKVELEEVRSALATTERKVKLKDEMAKAAMKAQEAAGKSLRLADRRTTELLSRIEQLTLQLEEAESTERSRRKLRHAFCWPWRAVIDATSIVAARYDA